MHMRGTYDQLDLEILKELRNDGKQSYRILANKLKIHPNTLMQRIKRLEQDKVIRGYTADIDYRKLGFDMHAIVMIRTHKNRSIDLWELQSIAKIPHVQILYAITGNHDAIAVLRVKDRDELISVLRKIQEVKAVLRTTTHVVLKSFKQTHEFNPLEAIA